MRWENVPSGTPTAVCSIIGPCARNRRGEVLTSSLRYSHRQSREHQVMLGTPYVDGIASCLEKRPKNAALSAQVGASSPPTP